MSVTAAGIDGPRHRSRSAPGSTLVRGATGCRAAVEHRSRAQIRPMSVGLDFDAARREQSSPRRGARLSPGVERSCGRRCSAATRGQHESTRSAPAGAEESCGRRIKAQSQRHPPIADTLPRALPWSSDYASEGCCSLRHLTRPKECTPPGFERHKKSSVGSGNRRTVGYTPCKRG